MRSRLTVLVAVLALVPVFSILSFGQSETASLAGVISDPKGAVVPDVQVTATRIETNTSYTAKTTSSGVYAFPSLQPGHYRVQVHAVGFKEVVLKDVELHVQDKLGRNFSLEIGTVSETVNVEGGVSQLNTESATVGTVVDRQFVENMPLNGRSFQSLIELVPGVVAAGTSGNNPGQFSINGQRTDANYFSVDGVSAHVGIGTGGSIGTLGAGSAPGVASTGGFNNLVSVDALQEFQIQTSSFAPEFGRTPGGQISIITRSGTNQFHGNVFDYLRNNFFDAQDWFSDYRGLAQPPLRQNDFGGTFGGPVIKNKLFFFASYEGLRLQQSFVSSGAFPTQAARTTPANGTAAAAAVLPYLKAYPLPNGAALDANLALFNANLPSTNHLDAGSIRADYHINDRMTLFGRYNDAPSGRAIRQLVGLQFIDIPVKTATLGHTWNVANSMINDLRFNYSNSSGLQSNGILDSFMGATPPTDAAVTNPSGISNGALSFSPNFTVAGVFMSGFQMNNHPANNTTRQINLIDSFSVVRGAHQLKFGFDWRQLTPAFAGMPYRATATMNTEAHLFQGLIDRLQVVTEPGQTYRFNNYSVYAQDTWKMSPKLTLTYGLRWDINPPTSSPNDTFSFALSHFDSTNLGSIALAPFGTKPYSTEWNAFGPRAGFAYQLSADPRWQRVFRGGFGLFFDTANDVSGLLFGPYTTSKTVTFTSPNFLSYPLSGNANLVPATVSLSPPFFAHTQTTDPNLKLPYFYQLNTAFEQALGANQTVTATYVGAIGHRLMRTQSYSSTAAGFASLFPSGLTLFQNGGTSDYHALQLQYQKRLSHGVQALASYTWSHSIDTSSAYTNGFLGGFSTSLNPAQDRGSSDFDIRHSVHAAVSYELPSPGAGNRFAHEVLGGWAVDNIYQFRTAPPFDLTAGGSVLDPATGQAIFSRPNLVAGQPLWLYGSICPQPTNVALATAVCPGGRRVNFAAFTAPTPGQQGNFPRNALRAFGLQQFDMTVRRDIALREQLHLQFRFDVFNIFNHPNFGPPVGTLSNGANSFGIVNQTLAGFLGGGGFNPLYSLGGARSIQMSLKLKF